MGECQDRGSCQVAFEAFKILLAFVCPFKWHPLAKQLIQGGSLPGIIRDKALIVCSQAKEGPYLFLCAGGGLVTHTGNLVGLCVHARGRNDMAQEFYLAAE